MRLMACQQIIQCILDVARGVAVQIDDVGIETAPIMDIASPVEDERIRRILRLECVSESSALVDEQLKLQRVFSGLCGRDLYSGGWLGVDGQKLHSARRVRSCESV